MMKQKGIARHHVLLVCLLVLVITLAVAAYVLQRNSAIKTVAGEAFRQRAYNPPGDLGLAPPPQDTIVKTCPDELTPSSQHWDLPGWKLVTWQVIDVRCGGKSISCSYGEILPSSVANVKDYQPDHLTFWQNIEGADKCEVLNTPGSGYACQCQKTS